MRGRHISNNIRLVLDLIDYSSLCSDDSLIFFLDLYKAFNTVEHNFIFQTIEHFGFGEKKKSLFRSLFQTDITTTPYVVQYWSNGLNWVHIWNLPYKYLITNKVREVSYKLIHKYYPAKHYLLRFGRDVCVNCSLCGSEPETMMHLFWNCHYTATFWKEVLHYIKLKIDSDFFLE